MDAKIKELQTQIKLFKGDLRSREYRNLKRDLKALKTPLKEAGDIIEDITKATGVKQAVKYLFGEDCGCSERKEAISKFFRRKTVNDLSEEEFLFIKEMIAIPKLKEEHQKKLRQIYTRVFEIRFKSSCSSCSFIKEIYNPLKRLHDIYEANRTN